MANDNTARDIDRAWDLMKKIGFAMLVTRNGNNPMTPILGFSRLRHQLCEDGGSRGHRYASRSRR
jgi:hypothetical protein